MDNNTIVVSGGVVKGFKKINDDFGVFRIVSNSRRCKEPLYIDVKVAGRLVPICEEYLAKGTQVNIVGRLELRTRRYEEKDMNINDYSIFADSLDFSNSTSRPKSF